MCRDFGIRSRFRNVCFEFRIGSWRDRIEVGETVGGCDPIVTTVCDEQIENLSMRQAVRDRVVYKLVTIESREPVVSAKPEIAARVGNDLVNAIARQAIGSRVGSNRKLFGAASRSRNENQDGDGKRSLHGAYDIP
jgi:hypothetical protein